jgi:hypothetical protein
MLGDPRCRSKVWEALDREINGKRWGKGTIDSYGCLVAHTAGMMSAMR